MDQLLNLISDPPPGVEPHYGFNSFAVAEVKAAVQSASITRAHGALLSALRDDVQVAAVRSLLDMALLPGVAELQSSIHSMAIRLEGGCFDKEGCADCRYNSSNHSELFETCVEPGLCVNAECASAKTEITVDLKARSLEPKYRVVKIMPVQFQDVQAGGETGVGELQATNCRESCTSFGAVVGASPGSALLTAENVCTDSDCHSRMVSAHQRAQVQAYKSRLWRYALERHIQAAPIHENRALLVALQALGWSPGDKLKSTLKLDANPSVAGILSACITMSQEQLVKAINQLPSAMIASAPLHQVGEVLRSLNVKLQDYWEMKVELLQKLSADELMEVAQDLQVTISEPMQKAYADSARYVLADAIGKALKQGALAGYVPRALQI